RRPPVIPSGTRLQPVRPRRGFRRISYSSGLDMRISIQHKSISILGNKTPERSCRTRVYDAIQKQQTVHIEIDQASESASQSPDGEYRDRSGEYAATVANPERES